MNDFDFDFSDLDSILAEFGAEAAPEEEANVPDEVPEDEIRAESYEEVPPEARQPIFFDDEDDDEAEILSGRDKKVIGHGYKSEAERMAEAERERRIESGEEPLYSRPKKRGDELKGFKRVLVTFAGLIFGVLGAAALFWMVFNVHPDSSMASSAIQVRKRADVATRVNAYTDNIKGELLSGLAVYRKHYIIPEEDLVCPEAPRYCYGSTKNPNEVLTVIQEARDYGLLADGEGTVFNPGADFFWESDIEYYCDETILAICWKELVDNRIICCSEIKIADGSQLRRKLAEDTYGSSTYVYATELAKQCNAVAAMNADYYAFRDLGMTVYNRKLYRFDDSWYSGEYKKYNATDTLFIDSNGDFIIYHKGDETTKEAIEQFVADNNIKFSIAFGPVIVEDYQALWTDWYPIGETDKEYSRACIGQVCDKHYLYATCSFADNGEYHPRCTINEFAQIVADKGVRCAYTLDGGQTGEVVFNGEPYNHIDFGTERTVSDIFYFASAIPASER